MPNPQCLRDGAGRPHELHRPEQTIPRVPHGAAAASRGSAAVPGRSCLGSKKRSLLSRGPPLHWKFAASHTVLSMVSTGRQGIPVRIGRRGVEP